MEDMLRVGVITSTHGIRGEVKVFPTTDDPLRFKKLKKCVIDGKREQVAVTVSSVKFFKQFVILKFKEFDDINDIEKYTKCDLLVSREGKHLGVLKDVLETGANNVYEVEADNGESYLIPVIDQCILDHDLDKKTITVHILPGLLDINK